MGTGHPFGKGDCRPLLFPTKVLLRATTNMPFGYSQLAGRIGQQGLSTPKSFVAPVVEPEVVYPSGTKFPTANEPNLSANYRPLPNNYHEVLQKMRHFQVANNVPIHLKGGRADMYLFGSTLAICGAGIFLTFKFIYDMSFPKKAE